MADTKTLEAKCFCGSVHFTINVPKSKLPMRTHLCHCSLCRYVLGSPCVFHTHLPPGVIPRFIEPSSPANMTLYPISNGASTWNFCSTCGCHIAAVGANDHWVPATSIFTDYSTENFNIWRHNFGKSCKDLGLSKIVTHINGREFAYYDPPENSPKAQITENAAEVGVDGKDRLRVKCHCEGVSFTIPRPTPAVLEDKFTAAFVSPSDKTKWLATFDVCDDCRLFSGTHVIGWTFVPLSICEPSIKPDLLIGTAKTFESSSGVLRSFCGTCGACVFYSHKDRHPTDEQQIVDIATGILRAPEGVMAENWLTWRARLAWMESGKRYDSSFTEALQDGMNKWILDKEGKIDDFNIG